MTIQTINEAWHDFVKATNLDNPQVPDIQRMEMKRAFFAGSTNMLGMFSLIGRNIKDPKEAAARLERYRQECVGFNEAVKMGAA